MNKDAFAPTPPMGWNSWDCYGASVTEEILLRNARYMAEKLRPFGWEYVVCDIQWSEPGADSKAYHDFAPLCMDEFGRLIPAPNRFPSSAGGKGFGPIADKIHAMGLKFGIHVMRGVPRQAAEKGLPVKGAPGVTARDIADARSVCAWNADMYGVRPGVPGAAEYYGSLLELYASWGVDFIKVDDICVRWGELDSKGEPKYAESDVEYIARAIEKCGRPIVLSLSPGAARLDAGWHMSTRANMWRMTNDLWDNWSDVVNMFDRWPDCDMIPFGRLDVFDPAFGGSGRPTRLTADEQRTLMTLWCCFRSPLFIGCELTTMDDTAKELFTDRELLDMILYGRDGRETGRAGGIVTRELCDDRGGKWTVVFNLNDADHAISPDTVVRPHGCLVSHS